MGNKKLKIIGSIVILITITILGCTYLKSENRESNESINNTEQKDEVGNSEYKSVLGFLNAIAGIKANSIEIIDNPTGFTGEIVAPKESIYNGVEYFLQQTKNEKMEELNIEIEEDYITIYVRYKVNKFINTPIEVMIKPEINEHKDLVINIEKVKFLDLKVADWIVNLALDSFVEDWFSKDSNLNLEFNKGNVVIYKENFNGVNINNISVEESGLGLDITINLEEILK